MLTIRRIAKGGVSRLSRIFHLSFSKLSQGKKRCNACGRTVSGFYRYGGRPFGCPFCRSSTRERFVNYALSSGRLKVPEGTIGVLHVAPSEQSLIGLFSQIPGYAPVDLFPQLYRATVTRKFDLMQSSSYSTYGLVYLSHVMEHVPDDRLVLKHIFKALKPGGEAWFLIPMWSKKTQDGTEGMSGIDRERAFGQWDHARMYGPDFEDRLLEAGFQVHILTAESMPDDIKELYGLQKLDWIFCAVKPKD